jgi:hypothetical protein
VERYDFKVGFRVIPRFPWLILLTRHAHPYPMPLKKIDCCLETRAFFYLAPVRFDVHLIDMST